MDGASLEAITSIVDDSEGGMYVCLKMTHVAHIPSGFDVDDTGANL
jgi:hypothetical protein